VSATTKKRWPCITPGRSEGIVPALESAHAIAYACKLARERGPDGLILVNLSGRGDKDVRQVAATRRTPPAAVTRVIAAGDRLAAVFARARPNAAAALIIYLVAGDPDAATTAAVIDAISPFVDVIELGIPYGDPLADGPTIAAAGAARARSPG
jgi:uncharacterized MnhB-related membrane protein